MTCPSVRRSVIKHYRVVGFHSDSPVWLPLGFGTDAQFPGWVSKRDSWDLYHPRLDSSLGFIAWDPGIPDSRGFRLWDSFPPVGSQTPVWDSLLGWWDSGFDNSSWDPCYCCRTVIYQYQDLDNQTSKHKIKACRTISSSNSILKIDSIFLMADLYWSSFGSINLAKKRSIYPFLLVCSLIHYRYPVVPDSVRYVSLSFLPNNFKYWY